MTVILHSAMSLLMLTASVVTYDYYAYDDWGSMANIPVESPDDNKLFPPRKIRPFNCNCESNTSVMNFGLTSHPSYLVTNTCVKKSCIDGINECREINYTVDVFVFKGNDQRGIVNNFGGSRVCLKLWEREPTIISVACVPVPIKRQS